MYFIISTYSRCPLFKRTFHFTIQDPTRFNIRKHLLLKNFIEVSAEDNADFSDQNIGANDTALQKLEYKHLLANLLYNANCSFAPPTYAINECNFAQVLALLQKKYADSNCTWIYKPATLNNGQGIKLFAHIDDIILHYQTQQRLGGDFVIQHYIDNPNLLDGHKYTLRLYVILTNYAGYQLYEHGYYNIGRQKYPGNDNFSDLSAHLTNEHLTEPLPNVIQMPTRLVPEFHLLMPQIKSIIDQTMQAFTQSTPEYFASTQHKAFDILGFDFLLDDTMKLWLLEINHGPWFPTKEPHNLLQHLFNAFWQYLVDDFAIPIAIGQPL